MVTVLRREEKYALHQHEAIYFANQFDQLLMKDSFSENGSYMVRSLYFDTITDRDFFEKINEQNFRRKIRLRIYDPADQTAKLEIKQKENVFQKKRSLTLSKEDALELIDGNYSVLFNYKDELADELYSLMTMGIYRPKTIIEYQRKAYMTKENDIRLTFDSEIRVTESSYDLFDENLLLYPIADANYVIFEAKYNRFMLSYVSDIISEIDRRSVTSSKYIMGRSIGYPGYL